MNAVACVSGSLVLCVRLNRAEIFGGKGGGDERSEGGWGEEWRA